MIHHNNKRSIFWKRSHNLREDTKRQQNQPTEKFISPEKEWEIYKADNNQTQGRKNKYRQRTNIEQNRNKHIKNHMLIELLILSNNLWFAR